MFSAKKIDMTEGPVMKLIFLFALPMCVGNILQQLYNTVDTFVIGNYCSSVSLAAVGTSSQPVEILLCVFVGLGNGVSILAAQHTGNGNIENLKEVVSTAVSFLYLCAIPVTILGLLAGADILKVMQVPESTWELSVRYMRIIFLGVLGNLGYNMNAGILRGLGDSRSSLLFLVISCIINIVLDFIFVAGLGMDVAGAALATIIAMFSSWLFSILYIRKKYPELAFTILPRRMKKEILLEIIRIGLPLGLINSIYSIGHVLLQSLINMQGAAFMAACAVASKVTSIANVTINSFSSAATTFSGQNLGAGKYVRLCKSSLKIPLVSGAFSFAGGMIVLFFGREILGLFTSDAEVLDMALIYLRVTLPYFWAYAIFNGFICFANGLGEVRYPMIVSILALWAVRIPCAHLIARFFDGRYMMACFPASFLFGMCAMLLFFRSKRWKEIKRLAKEEQQDT
ncbi:MATE efflux family protein [Marvinbryantia formatexigens DSM 14469]|uniref:MATE efflux family protein n=2 Tax=Marvinbryantia TaxID=248744 RepID=C6LLU5_9FIRM|nr:MATE efflux family protein [Marvinbryantia formatexigens DSM 14469]